MIQKPKLGAPCNSCGMCCQLQLCPLGQRVFDQVDGPCPGLRWVGEESRCGLVLNPREFAPVKAAVHGVAALREAALLLTAAGLGCDGRDGENPDADDPEYIRIIIETNAVPSAEIRAAIRKWT